MLVTAEAGWWGHGQSLDFSLCFYVCLKFSLKKKVKCFSLQIIGYVEKDFLAAGKKSNLSPFFRKEQVAVSEMWVSPLRMKSRRKVVKGTDNGTNQDSWLPGPVLPLTSYGTWRTWFQLEMPHWNKGIRTVAASYGLCEYWKDYWINLWKGLRMVPGMKKPPSKCWQLSIRYMLVRVNTTKCPKADAFTVPLHWIHCPVVIDIRVDKNSPNANIL